MILSDHLAFVLYTSTKGHFGQKNLYKFTIERLKEKITFYDEFFKLAHIKVSPGEEELAQEMEDWLYEQGWLTIRSKGEWSHNNTSHAVGYYKDKLKAFSEPLLHRFKYSIFLEDDWVLNIDESRFYLLFNEALRFLNQRPDALCVRINNEAEEHNPLDLRVNKFLYCQGLFRNQYGPTFTFQPTIIRTLEWYQALRLINKNLDQLQYKHCEIMSGEAMKNFSDSVTPFYYFDPKFVSVTHIGEQGMEDKLKT